MNGAADVPRRSPATLVECQPTRIPTIPRPDPTRRTTRIPRLLERVIQQRRHAGDEAGPATGDTDADHEQRIAALEQRLEDLENLLEGLQDSVHRESVRQRKEVKELEKSIAPAEIARALGRHAREHGI
jgi:hypothetical protein